MTVRIAVLGTGAWPLTISRICSQNGHLISIWSYRQAIADELNNTGTYKKSLNEKKFETNVFSSTNMEEVINDSDVIIVGMASSYIKHVVEMSSFCGSKPILILTKGLLNSSEHLFISDYIKELCPKSEVALLSGPNLAGEILESLPSATVIASDCEAVSKQFQKVINHPVLRVYTSNDLRGVEIGGVLKNIMAIAAGCCDGLGYGVNTKSALLTRGLQEIIRFSKEFSCHTETFFGLSGVGDLIATCHSKESRNYKFGFYLGGGFSKEQSLQKVGRVIEGINTLEVVYNLAKKKKIELPIVNEVYNVVFNKKLPRESIKSLMTRMLRSE
jgi:glycerol-3-phosphate dehydrogenase (NAD(P)+)